MCRCSAKRQREVVSLDQRFKRFEALGIWAVLMLKGSEFHRLGATTAKARHLFF